MLHKPGTKQNGRRAGALGAQPACLQLMLQRRDVIKRCATFGITEATCEPEAVLIADGQQRWVRGRLGERGGGWGRTSSEELSRSCTSSTLSFTRRTLPGWPGATVPCTASACLSAGCVVRRRCRCAPTCGWYSSPTDTEGGCRGTYTQSPCQSRE